MNLGMIKSFPWVDEWHQEEANGRVPPSVYQVDIRLMYGRKWHRQIDKNSKTPMQAPRCCRLLTNGMVPLQSRRRAADLPPMMGSNNVCSVQPHGDEFHESIYAQGYRTDLVQPGNAR